MLKMIELREKMKVCLQGKLEFSTTELKEWLEQYGYVYNTDYDVNSFSNAVASLTKQKYIASMKNSDRKGNYQVIYKADIRNENDKENEKNKDREMDNEPELKEMREKILELLQESSKKIENLLDTEKLSTYRRNHRTYDEILKLLEYLEHFDFIIDK